MNEKTICPLCGGAAPCGKCLSCGYAIPDDIDLDYNTKLNDFDPEDYPQGEAVRNMMNAAPLHEERRFDLMPDVNDVSSEPPVYADPKLSAAAHSVKSNMPAAGISNPQDLHTGISPRELAAAIAVFVLSVLPLLPAGLPLFGGIVLLFTGKGKRELVGLAAVIAVILRILASNVWNGLF